MKEETQWPAVRHTGWRKDPVDSWQAFELHSTALGLKGEELFEPAVVCGAAIAPLLSQKL